MWLRLAKKGKNEQEWTERMKSIFLGHSNIQVWELLQVLKKTPLKGALKNKWFLQF